LSSVAVADASPLILLSRADYLQLLKLLDPPIQVPDTVAQEIRQKGEEDITVQTLNRDSRLEIVRAPPIPVTISRRDLGAGESAVLAVAQALPDSIALLDDLTARRCAQALDIPVMGTAGLVLAAKRRGVIGEARPVLERLMAHGMYLSPRTLKELLRRVEE